jgi:hypothetical protein
MGRTKSRRSISFRGMGAARTLDLLSSGGSKPKGRAMNRRFVDFANAVAEGSGYPAVFAAAIVVVVVWLAAGPVFHFSDTWQLVMNTLTSVVTFLMVFLIQTSQNRDSTAFRQSSTSLSEPATPRICSSGWSIYRPTKSKRSGSRCTVICDAKERAATSNERVVPAIPNHSMQPTSPRLHLSCAARWLVHAA